MKIFIPLILCSLFLVPSIDTNAQKPVNGTITKIPKFKPPVVSTFLGRNKDTVSVTVEEALQLIGLPLKVVDAKNVAYPVSSYGFVYRRSGVVENEESGKKEVKFTTVGDQFYKTPLPEVWKVSIRETLKKGEQFYFFDIIVKDKQNRPFFSPQVLIKII